MYSNSGQQAVRLQNNICLRSVYKPHSVQRTAPLGRSSLYAVYPRLIAERAVPRLCLTLLPAGVAWPPALLQTPVVSYTTFSPSPKGCLFLWPDPIDYSIPRFPRRRALWSADFPRPRKRDRDHPTNLRRCHHTRKPSARQPTAFQKCIEFLHSKRYAMRQNWVNSKGLRKICWRMLYMRVTSGKIERILHASIGSSRE